MPERDIENLLAASLGQGHWEIGGQLRLLVESRRRMRINELAIRMSLETYIAKFTHLTVNQAHGRTSPHKICMLLALLDLARAGGLRENRIGFAPPLLGRYREYFAAVREPGDWPNPWFPFFHLKGDLRGGGASFLRRSRELTRLYSSRLTQR